MRPLPPLLRNLIVPAISLLLLSSCFILAGHLYNTVYRGLFAMNTTALTATDYVLPQKQIDAVLAALDSKAQSTVNLADLRNPFSQRQTQ